MTTYVYEFPAATGGAKYFISGDYVYSVRGGQPAYRIDDGWWYDLSSRAVKFWVRDRYVYEPSGSPRYFLS